MNVPRVRLYRLLLATLLMLAGTAALTQSSANAALTTAGSVYVVEVHGPIDLGLVPYLARVLREAERQGASAVILDLNTTGGRLDAVLQMRSAILDSPVRTIAFVNRTAVSGGALVAIAAHETYMTPGAVLGAATPMDGRDDAAKETAASALRSTFRATAEVRGRDPRIAAAMVDPDVDIDGLTTPGRLLSLTATEAQQWQYANGVVADRRALLTATGLAGVPVLETTPRLAEQAVRFLTTPLVAALLISAGMLLLLVDLFTAGFGFVGLLGLALLALFFWGHALAGLAGWEGLALVALGLVLLALEVLVIPGFGVAGVLGLAALLGGLFISLIGGEVVTQAELIRASSTVAMALITTVAGGAALLWLLPQMPGLRGLVLQTSVGWPDAGHRRHGLVLADPYDEDDADAYESLPGPAPRSLVGAAGVALSPLRPGGFAWIGDERVDVVTEGGYIAAGEPLEVVADEGYRRVVRRVTQQESGLSDAGVAGTR